MVGGRVNWSQSGGITFDTLRDYAECGVDYISVGALTHSVKGLDMSFNLLRLTERKACPNLLNKYLQNKIEE